MNYRKDLLRNLADEIIIQDGMIRWLITEPERKKLEQRLLKQDQKILGYKEPLWRNYIGEPTTL